MSNVIVLGDGLLGSEIIKQTEWDYISRKKNHFDFNKSDFSELKKYNTIVNCIANTNTYDNSKEAHWDTNYASVYKLALFCNDINAKLIHISSDFVYANNTHICSENDAPVHFENWYALTKLLADNIIELVSNNYLICRETHIPNPFPYASAFIDRYGNFSYVDQIARVIIELINKNISGLYNIGGEPKSMYELAKQTKPDVKESHTSSLGYVVPINTAMNCEKSWNFLRTYLRQ